MTNAQKQAEFMRNQNVAIRLREVLGSDYMVDFDSCESGLTRLYYKGVLYKEVLNTEMVPEINVIEFSAPQELKYRIHFGLPVDGRSWLS